MRAYKQSDIEVWNRFRSGDDGSLSVIYAQNAEILYRYGLKFTSNHDLVEDSIHDLFIDLIKTRKSIGKTDNIRFYLLKAFRRKLFKLMKKEYRYGDEEISDDVFGIKYSIEDELIHSEEHENKINRLREAIKQLSPRQKEAIYLRYQKELDYSEISEILDMGLEAARNLIYRAVKSLKNSLLDSSGNSVLFFILKKIKKTFKKNQI